MHFTLLRVIDNRCWVYRDQLGHEWCLGFQLPAVVVLSR